MSTVSKETKNVSMAGKNVHTKDYINSKKPTQKTPVEKLLRGGVELIRAFPGA